MNNENQIKNIFANLQDLLASLPEKERYEFRRYLEKNEIIGNQTLEPIILMQYNTALFIDSAIEKLKTSYSSSELSMKNQEIILNDFRKEFERSIQTSVNLAHEKLNGSILKTVEVSNEQVSKLNNSVINLVDNISSYIDVSMAKMLDQMAEERLKGINEINAFFEVLKKQLESEIQIMIIEIAKKLIPTELKKSVKEPIANHLQKYLGIVKERTEKLDTSIESNQLWNIKRLLRDFVVTGAAIFVLKFFHLI